MTLLYLAPKILFMIEMHKTFVSVSLDIADDDSA